MSKSPAMPVIVSIPVKPWLKKYMEAKEYYDGECISYRRSHNSILFMWSLFRVPKPGEINMVSEDETFLTFHMPAYLARQSRVYLDDRGIEMLHEWARREMTTEFLHEAVLLRASGISMKDCINRILTRRYGIIEDELHYDAVRKAVNRYRKKVESDAK